VTAEYLFMIPLCCRMCSPVFFMVLLGFRSDGPKSYGFYREPFCCCNCMYCICWRRPGEIESYLDD